MSEAPEDPLDVVYVVLNPAEEGLHDPPDSGVNSVDAGEAFLTALAGLGIEGAVIPCVVQYRGWYPRVTRWGQ